MGRDMVDLYSLIPVFQHDPNSIREYKLPLLQTTNLIAMSLLKRLIFTMCSTKLSKGCKYSNLN